jgi:hypothetical protein
MVNNYKDWSTDELLAQVKSNRLAIFNLNVSTTEIMDILEARIKEAKEVMYND